MATTAEKPLYSFPNGPGPDTVEWPGTPIAAPTYGAPISGVPGYGSYAAPGHGSYGFGSYGAGGSGGSCSSCGTSGSCTCPGSPTPRTETIVPPTTMSGTSPSSEPGYRAARACWPPSARPGRRRRSVSRS